ncbi:unnamed protein product [Urochloa humidicola]
MGDSEVLVVRFHFNGAFVLDGSTVEYCNGDEGISHIEKDKLSVPELEGHLLDHTTFKRSVMMYWLPFGAALNSGLRLIVDDKSCLDMLDELGCVGAVDIYTELIDVDHREPLADLLIWGRRRRFDLGPAAVIRFWGVAAAAKRFRGWRRRYDLGAPVPVSIWGGHRCYGSRKKERRCRCLRWRKKGEEVSVLSLEEGEELVLS